MANENEVPKRPVILTGSDIQQSKDEVTEATVLLAKIELEIEQARTLVNGQKAPS